MSGCVVRMEMPQGCWCCPFGHYDWIWGDDGREKMVCFCCLDLESEEDSHYLLETEMKRPSWCPIICQLPEGHGRLVDEKEVKDWVENWLCVNKYYHPYSSSKSIPVSDLYDVLQRMDASVPAERRANDGK